MATILCKNKKIRYSKKENRIKNYGENLTAVFRVKTPPDALVGIAFFERGVGFGFGFGFPIFDATRSLSFCPISAVFISSASSREKNQA